MVRPAALLFYALLLIPAAVLGHRLDEYLQSTLVVIEPGEMKLQVNLTPGVAVAKEILTRIDRNADDTISRSEAAIYAELVKQDFAVRADGRELSLEITAADFPLISELRGGMGIIQLEFSSSEISMTTGRHTIVVENRHQTNLSVYLINAAKPKSAKITIVKQKRSDNQAVGEIEFARAGE